MQQIFRMKDAAGNEYDVPNSDLAEFSGAVKDAQPVNRYRDDDGNSYDVPASDIQEFRAAVPSHEQVRTMTFADGSKRDFTLPELDKFLRSKEWREGEAYKADRDERDRIVAERVAPDGERSGFLGELSRRLLSAEGIRENAEDSSLAKPYAYLNDLANSLVSGFLGAGSKITEAAGHAIGDNAVGRALVEEGRAGQQTLRRALPTDMLDTSGGGVVDKVLQTGKGVASVTGEFAPAMLSGVGPAYAAGVVSSGAVNRSAEVYEAATANGYSPVEANALAMGAGAVDAVQNMLLMGSFKGIWKGAEKTAADAVKRSLVKKLTVDTLKTGATMGTGAAAQDVVNQAAGIDEKGNVAEPTDYSWTRTAKAGAEGFLEGGMFHLVNSAAHALPKAIAWEGEAKTMSAQASRDALETPEGRSLVMLNSPKAAEAILDARLKGKDVSRKMLRALGIHDEVAPSVADRNALADALVKDYAAYQKFLAGKPEPSMTGIENPDEALKPPKEASNETRNGADEAPAKPAEGTAGEPKVGEAADAKAPVPPRAEAPREGVVEQGKSPATAAPSAETPAQPAENGPTTAPKPTEAQTPTETAKPAEAASRASGEPRTEGTVVREIPEAQSAAREAINNGTDFNEATKRVKELQDELNGLRTDRIKAANDEEVYKIWRENVDLGDKDLAKIAAAELESRGYKPNEEGYGWVKPDGKGRMKKAKKPKAEEPPPPVEEQTVPAEAPTSAEAVRDSMRNDPELQRIDAAYKAAKTDAERNALKANFEERVEELKANGTLVLDAEARDSAKKVKLSEEAIADIKDWMEKNPDGDFTHDGMQKIFDAEMERVKAANGGVRPGDVMPTIDAISVAYKDMKAAARASAAEKSTRSKRSLETHSVIDDGRRNLAASKNTITEQNKKGDTIQTYTPTDGGAPFKVLNNSFKHGMRGKEAEDNKTVGRHIGETLEVSHELPESTSEVRFRMAKVKIGGEEAHVLFTIKKKSGELEKIDVLKRLNKKRSLEETTKSAEGGVGRDFEAVEDSISNLEKIWQERFKPGIEKHNKSKGRNTVWKREEQPTASVETDSSAEVASFDKTIKSALSEEGRPSERLHDAAERLVDHILDFNEGDANIEKELDKALADFKEKHSLETFIKPSEAYEYFKEFADELAAKYKVPGYDGKAEPPRYTGRKMNVGTVDSIQESLFELRGKYADTEVADEGIFDELPFRKVDAEKLGERNLKELKKLGKEFANRLFDIDVSGNEDLTGDIIDKDNSILDSWRADIDKFVEAKDNLNRFLEQAERYQHLKRDKKGRPIFSPSAPAKETVTDTIADLDRIIASEEAGKPSGGETAAEGLPARSESWAPGKGVSRVKAFFGGLVSKNSVVRAIKDTFPEFAVRGKNTTRIGASYSGHFEPWRELVRSKDMADIDTIPHEIGHGISMRTKRRMMNIPQEAKRDLARMGRELYGSKKPNGGYMEEGWAEYIRGYMTGADDLAIQAPHLDKWFREKFAEAHPDYVRKIDRIRKEIMRYRLQSDLQRAAAEQNPETSAMRRAWEKVENFFSAENWDDEGATLTRGYEKSGLADMHKWQGEMRELEKLYKKGQGNSPRAAELQKSIEEKVLTDPRIFASNARGTSKARTLDMMKYGITNLTGTEKVGDVTGFDANGNAIRNNNTESYRDIFGNFTGKELKQWDLYAAAKIGLENYVKKGKEFGVDKAALERRVAALENPKFLDALDRFTKMSRRALSVGLEAGALTPKQYQKIVGEHQYYVRTERRLAEDGAGGGRSQSNPIHKIKGSTKNIMPPRVATMMQIEKQLRYFQTMKVLNMLAKDVRKAEVANGDFYKTGNGREYQVAANLPVQVANAQEAVKFGSEKLRKDLTKKMVDTGAATDKAAADALFDQLFNDGADQLTVFRERPSKGKNGLVSTYIDGKLVTFELPDAKWAKYITGMESGFDNGPSGKVWDSITAPGKLLRFGATTAHPAFATANFVRDTYHSAIMSETGAKPLVSSVIGMLNDVMGMDAGRLFKQMGGEMSMLMGSSKEAQFKHLQNAALADNILKQVAADTSLVNPLSGVLRVYTDILSKPEMGPRVREVMGVMKRGQAAGLSREASAWLAFAAGKDISMDFGKHGKYMKVLNQVIPYTNAWYRGLEQFARNMGLKKALPTQFEDRQGVRAMRTAGRGMLYLSATAVANSIANMLMMDEKERRAEFNKTPREKWEYDDILGTVRVPLPFELGAVFYAIPKAIVYEAFGDKGAVKEAIWHGLSTNLGKYSNVEDFTSGITAIAPFVDMLRNKKWDDSPLVSPHIMDAYPKDRQKWYDYSTTEAAKWVGEKMDWAPAYIDHVANTWSGGMWKRLLSPTADTTLATQTGASTFIPRPTARRDVHEFYDSRSELQSHYNAGSASVEDVGKLARANKLHEKLSPLFKEARELAANEPDKAERRKKREAIMDKAFDLIHKFNVAEADDRKGGLAHAADALTRSAEIEPSVREKNLAVLKGASYDEIKAALRAYGKEKLPVAVKNKAGFKTGRIKYERRWSDETIRLRIRRLYKEFHGEE